jgi:transmembrane 9 superfamily protein 2/4
MGAAFNVLMGGILPFGAIFIELFFIMTSVWLQRFYYVFGFLALVLLILVVTCSEIAVVLCYFQLCNEDYEWCEPKPNPNPSPSPSPNPNPNTRTRTHEPEP